MNSNQRAREWPFPRHRAFSKTCREAAADWFTKKGYTTNTKMPYCLAKWSDWKSNIILPDVADYFEEKHKDAERMAVPFPLHKYLHHGMSSQAMAFNLIGPMVVSKDYSPLVAVLRAKHIQGAENVVDAEFEYSDRKVFNEDAGQPTSIDIALKDSMGKPLIFMESKFEERDFGGCSVFGAGDCDGRNPIGSEASCFLHFVGREYWPLMKKHGISYAIQNDRQCLFTSHYQFFREVILALEKGGTFVLLSDERSPVFHCRSDAGERGLMPFLASLLPEAIRGRVASISTQELVAEIERHERHRDWVAEFKDKYGM